MHSLQGKAKMLSISLLPPPDETKSEDKPIDALPIHVVVPAGLALSAFESVLDASKITQPEQVLITLPLPFKELFKVLQELPLANAGASAVAVDALLLADPILAPEEYNDYSNAALVAHALFRILKFLKVRNTLYAGHTEQENWEWAARIEQDLADPESALAQIVSVLQQNYQHPNDLN